MRGRSLAIAVLGWAVLNVTSLASGGSLDAADANSEPALTATPSSVEAFRFSRSPPIRVQVELKAGSKDLSGIVLSSFSNDTIIADVEGGDSAANVALLTANAAHVWTLLLKPIQGSAFPPTALNLYVQASYFDGTNPTIQHVAFTTVTINAPGETLAPTMAAVEIKGALDALSFERPAKAFVVVTNKYSSELTIVDIGVHGPPFTRFTPTCDPANDPVDNPANKPTCKPADKPPYPALAYGETKVIEYDVKAPELVVPGKYPVVVVVHLRGADGITGSVTASPEIDVGVLGESDLLSKLGAPSLLFLPGVLFLLTWQLLWSRGKTAAEKQGYSLQPTVPTFWLIGVVISLITPLVYPTIIRWVLHDKRDYLVAYGLRDYMYVFGLAIVASCALFYLWVFLNWLWRRAHAFWLTFFTPSIADGPIAILKKLGRHHSETSFRQAYLEGGNQNQLLLVLEPWSQDDNPWLAPPAVLTLTAETNYQAVQLSDQIKNGLITDARQLANIIQQGVDAGWWTIAWMTVGQNNRLVMAPANTWHFIQARNRLVR